MFKKNRLLSFLTMCFVAFGLANLSLAKEFLYTSSTTGPIDVIDLSTNAITKTIHIAQSGSFKMAVNPSGTRLYAPERNSNSLHVIDTTSLEVIATVPVGYDPVAIAISPSGNRGYVVSYAAPITVFDTVSNNVMATIPLNRYGGDVIVSNDGSLLYVSDGTSAVCVIDTATNE